MAAQSFDDILAALGRQFGQLDNAVEKWAALGADLAEYDAAIREALLAQFGAGSAPEQIFTQAAAKRDALAAALPAKALADEGQPMAAGYLHLRCFVYLNGFLQACAESVEKVRLNAGLDAAELVEKSYYRPYFFERVTISTDEVVAMLEADLARLREMPQDKKGVVGALRIRKGIVSTMVESYCPAHPWYYPLAARLDAIPTSADPAVIGQIEAQLAEILAGIKLGG